MCRCFGCDTIRVCLFCLSTEFGVDENALFVRLRGVFNSTLITLSESKKVTILTIQHCEIIIRHVCTIYGQYPASGKRVIMTRLILILHMQYTR
jgi:hypothetical protein